MHRLMIKETLDQSDVIIISKIRNQRKKDLLSVGCSGLDTSVKDDLDAMTTADDAGQHGESAVRRLVRRNV